MSDQQHPYDSAQAKQMMEDIGLSDFMIQVGSLQESLGRVAEGMKALGESSVKQVRDTENLAAHVLAIESVLTAILRHIPIDPAEVRAEAMRRTGNVDADPDGGTPVVVQLAEDILRRADD